MLVTPKKIINEAYKKGYAIGSFNTSDMEITKAIIAAAENLAAPVMIETSERAISYAGLETISAIIKEQAKKAKVPIALHLDHGKTLDMVNKCINEGYTSVMFDGSRLPYLENKIYTKKAVDMAHRAGITCEGELGPIKKAGEPHLFTDPNEVKDFIKFTKVDFLAVSVGSAHGISDDEKINLKLLKEIKKRSKIPLVLHGASGISKYDIHEAIKLGIAKINIDTDIRHTFAKAIHNIKNKKLDDPRDIMKLVIEEIKTVVEQKILMFGSDGKAK